MAIFTGNLISEEDGYLSFEGLAAVISAFPGVWRSNAVWLDTASGTEATAKTTIPNWAGLVDGTATTAQKTVLETIKTQNRGFMLRARARMNGFPWRSPVSGGAISNEWPRTINGTVCVPDGVAQAFTVLVMYYAAEARNSANPALELNLGQSRAGVATFGFDAVSPLNSETVFRNAEVQGSFGSVFAERKEYANVSNAMLDIPYSVIALIVKDLYLSGVRRAVRVRQQSTGDNVSVQTQIESGIPTVDTGENIPVVPGIPQPPVGVRISRTYFTGANLYAPAGNRPVDNNISNKINPFTGARSSYAGATTSRLAAAVTSTLGTRIPTDDYQFLRIDDLLTTKDNSHNAIEIGGRSWKIGAYRATDNQGTSTETYQAGVVESTTGGRDLVIVLSPEEAFGKYSDVVDVATMFQSGEWVAFIEGAPQAIYIPKDVRVSPFSESGTNQPIFDSPAEIALFIPNDALVLNANPEGDNARYGVWFGKRTAIASPTDILTNSGAWTDSRNAQSLYQQTLEFVGNDTIGYTLDRINFPVEV